MALSSPSPSPHWLATIWSSASSLIPRNSPLRDPVFSWSLVVSLLIQHSLFHWLANTRLSGSDPKQQKKRAWILTTFNGGITTLLSLPYLSDLFFSGFDFHKVRHRLPLTHAGCAFFIVYLASDLGLGSIYYRKLINLSSGWIHHTVYVGLFAFWVHKGWAHIAMMASIFELPTFIMGIASIHPPLRSNNAFTSTFLLTRVVLHAALLCAACTPHGRAAPGIDGSWGPCISMAVTLPMHLWWGYKCILSVRRRMHKRKLAAKAEREKEANAFVNIAAQAFNGFKAPDASSAVNTPLPTPNPSPVLGPVRNPLGGAAAIQHAFAKAAAASRRPVDLVLKKRRRQSAGSGSGGEAVPDIHLAHTDDEKDFESRGMTPTNSSTDSLLLRVPSNHASSGKVSSRNAVAATNGATSPRDPRHSPSIRPFTAPVRPDGATPDSHEPFLAIRSAAEGTDRARRLVADAVRRMWFGAPESWRRQFEEEARLMEQRQRREGRTRAVDGIADRDEADDLGDGEDLDAVIAHDDPSASRGSRARAMLRRGVLRAVRRAIDGNNGNDNGVVGGVLAPPPSGGDDEEVTPLVLDGSGGEDSSVASANIAATQRLAQSLLNISRRTLPLPPDLTGEEYEVRPLDVEKRQGEGERTKRFVAKLRRKMEVRNRDVVVWD